MSQDQTWLHDAIQNSHLTDHDEPSVLLGWVIVAEWMGSDGQRWLSRSGAPADPHKSLPSWQRRGYLYEAISGSWERP